MRVWSAVLMAAPTRSVSPPASASARSAARRAVSSARRPRAGLGERRSRCDTSAAFHDRLDEGFAHRVFPLDGKDIPDDAAVQPVVAPHLLASGPCGLAGRSLAPRQARVLLQLVGAVEGRDVEGCREAGADAEAVDWSLLPGRLDEFPLIDAAAREDGDVLEPTVVQDAPHAVDERDQVAAVQSHAANLDAFRFQPRREGDHRPRRRLGVIGIDQQDQVVGPGAGKRLEGRLLGVVSLNERMGHGAVDGNPEQLARQHGVAVPPKPAM